MAPLRTCVWVGISSHGTLESYTVVLAWVGGGVYVEEEEGEIIFLHVNPCRITNLTIPCHHSHRIPEFAKVSGCNMALAIWNAAGDYEKDDTIYWP